MDLKFSVPYSFEEVGTFRPNQLGESWPHIEEKVTEYHHILSVLSRKF